MGMSASENMHDAVVADDIGDRAGGGIERLRLFLRYPAEIARDFFEIFAHHRQRPLSVASPFHEASADIMALKRERAACTSFSTPRSTLKANDSMREKCASAVTSGSSIARS